MGHMSCACQASRVRHRHVPTANRRREADADAHAAVPLTKSCPSRMPAIMPAMYAAQLRDPRSRGTEMNRLVMGSFSWIISAARPGGPAQRRRQLGRHAQAHAHRWPHPPTQRCHRPLCRTTHSHSSAFSVLFSSASAFLPNMAFQHVDDTNCSTASSFVSRRPGFSLWATVSKYLKPTPCPTSCNLCAHDAAGTQQSTQRNPGIKREDSCALRVSAPAAGAYPASATATRAHPQAGAADSTHFTGKSEMFSTRFCR